MSKISAVSALLLATALWMFSGGALMAAAQGSTVGSESGAEVMFPTGTPIPDGSTFVPDGTTSGGTTLPSGSILIPAGSVLPDGTTAGAGTVLYPDGTLMVFGDSASWPTGDVVPTNFAFAPQSLPFTGGNQGSLALVGAALIMAGTTAYVARKRLIVE